MSENLVQYVIDAGKGDTSAMGMLYAKTLRTSYFLASKLSGSDAQATEITKKAYARAFCTIDKLLRPEAFEIWIKQIVASIYKDSVKFIFADADANAQEPTTDFLPEEKITVTIARVDTADDAYATLRDITVDLGNLNLEVVKDDNTDV